MRAFREQSKKHKKAVDDVVDVSVASDLKHAIGETSEVGRISVLYPDIVFVKALCRFEAVYIDFN